MAERVATSTFGNAKVSLATAHWDLSCLNSYKYVAQFPISHRPVEIQCDFSILGKSGSVWFPTARGQLPYNPRKIWLFEFHAGVT
jgi:hypothetical protein